MTPEERAQKRAVELIAIWLAADPADERKNLDDFANAIAAALAEKDKEIERLTVCYNHDHKLAIDYIRYSISACSEAAALREERDALKDEVGRRDRSMQAARVEGLREVKQFAVSYRCSCAGNYPGSQNYHGPDCENAVAQDFVTDFFAALERGKE